MLTEPKLHVLTGPMFSGKTSALLRHYTRHELGGLKVQMYKPRLDNRYSNYDVTNHDKSQRVRATLVTSEEHYDFEEDIQRWSLDALFVDEAQFLSGESIRSLFRVVEQLGKRVFLACLDLDWARDPFQIDDFDTRMTTGDIFAKAQVVEKFTAICRHVTPGKGLCGREACYTRKTVYNEKIVEVGGQNLYEPVCWEHWRMPDAETRENR